MPGERISSLALMRDLIPFDANIDYGMVVCHASGSVTINGVSTPTTDRSIVLPNHAAARLAGRAFAGICQQQGDQPNVSVSTPLDLTVDNQILVQKSWIAECRLKLNTACVVGTLAAYDPADGGPVVPFTVNMQGGGSTDPARDGAQVARQIERVVVPLLQKHMRPGGVLARKPGA